MKNVAKFAILCAFWGVFCIPSAWAGPFGIDMGMSLDKVKQVCKTTPERVEDDLYLITPLKTNNLFETYAVRIDSDHGVYWIKAIGKEIYADDYGRELIATFESLVESIEKTYGMYEKIDKKEGFFGGMPQYFMHALSQGDRLLAAVWGAEYKSQLPSDIHSIAVMVNSISPNSGCVTLEYAFSNQEMVKNKADAVF